MWALKKKPLAILAAGLIVAAALLLWLKGVPPVNDSLLSIDHPFKAHVYGGGEHMTGETFDFEVVVSRESEFFTIRTKEQPQHPWTYHYVTVKEVTWTVEPISVGTSGEILQPGSATIPGATIERSTRFSGKTALTCAQPGRDRIELPEGVRIEFIFESDEAIPEIAGLKIPGEGNQYKGQVEITFASNNTLLYVNCKEGDGMIRVQAPTTIICEESGRGYTGYPKIDPETGEEIEGVLIDLETGEEIDIICP